MECSIELWLRGSLFQRQDLTIPENDDRVDFRTNYEFRQMVINAAIMKLKAMYHNQIDKCGNICQVVVVMPSRVHLVADEEI
jgi:hypothetical protein